MVFVFVLAQYAVSILTQCSVCTGGCLLPKLYSQKRFMSVYGPFLSPNTNALFYMFFCLEKEENALKMEA